MAVLSKTRVGVLRGGPSKEHAVSLKTGANVLKHLPDSYVPVDIFIDRNGAWHVGGVPRAPEKALRQVDVFWNALHGEYGEDGKLQHFLDHWGKPYTGSGRLASAFAMHKGHAKKLLSGHGIRSPYHKLFKKDELVGNAAHELFRTIPHPAVVKPVALGSSLGVFIARDFFEFEKALEQALAESPTVMIEEYIAGREATCGVLDDFRGEETYALLPVELVLPKGSQFFDYEAKYGGKSKAMHPGRFSEMEKHAIQTAARAAHEALGLRHYSRSDFIVSPTRGVYFLEVNSLPYLAADSPYLESLACLGASFGDFLDHILRLALLGK